ncbi:MAG: AAA family ATPase, partial [Rhodopila sp.]|nr:AAA family ATPase [Rhodopila sp.]
FARWQLPVILCARTGLGTINHTLLSLEAMRQRQIPILGVAFTGDDHPDSEQIIVEMGGVRSLGRLPRLDPLTPDALRQSFHAHFNISLFQQVSA